MKVLIFGSEGFIGRNLSKRLSVHNEVFTSDILEGNSKNYLSIDILNKNDVFHLIQDYRPDVVINLAARTDLNGKKLEDYEVNWQGSINISESIVKLNYGTMLVHFSSMLVCKMGHNPKNMFEYYPDTVYGESKAKSEETLESFKENFPLMILRPTTVWGDDAGKPYSTFIKIVSRIGWIKLSIFDAKRDFCEVDKLSGLIEDIIKIRNRFEKSYFNKFYISNIEKNSVNDLAELISLNSKKPIISLPILDFFIRVLIRIVALLGDLFGLLNINFILNSRRIENMKMHTDLPVHLLNEEITRIDTKE